MSKRPKRTVTTKSDIPDKLPRKWNDEEMETLLTSIMHYGHKNLVKIQENLPGRSLDNIKTFMRTVLDTASKMGKKNEVIDFWINKCDAFEGTSWRDCIQIAKILKYLSVDGLLENHPLPERCQGIDFRQAYRLLYDVMMGYPIRPVNQPTADFVLEALAELNGEVKKETDAIKNVNLFLQNKTIKEKPNSNADSKIDLTNTNNAGVIKKAAKVYQRKKPIIKTEDSPSLKIVVTESLTGSKTDVGCSKDFSVIVEGKDSSLSTTVNVPVPCEVSIDEDEQELLKSSSYNPFQIPKKWLEEPLYINLIQKL